MSPSIINSYDIVIFIIFTIVPYGAVEFLRRLHGVAKSAMTFLRNLLVVAIVRTVGVITPAASG